MIETIVDAVHTVLATIAVYEALNQPIALYAGLAGFAVYTWFIQYWFFENYFSGNWVGMPIQALLVRTNIVLGVVLTAWATAVYGSALVGLAVSVGIFIPLVAVRLLFGAR